MLNSSVDSVLLLMVDFQKTEVFGVDSELWLNHPLLVFVVRKTVKTGQERSKRIAKYGTLEFIIVQSGRMFIHGSIHKYFNFIRGNIGNNQKTKNDIDKGFNGNDFTIYNLIEALFDLEEKFSVSFQNSQLANLEVGVNFPHSFVASLVLMNLMLFHGKTFKKPLSCTFREVEQNQNLLKFYDKQLQYDLDCPLLRFELKYVSMLELNKIGVKNLNDLFDQAILRRIKELLLKRWDEVLFYDYSINTILLCKADAKRCLRYSNENYWSTLAPNRRHRPKQYYKRIEADYSNHIQNQISDLIGSTWDRLVCNK